MIISVKKVNGEIFQININNNTSICMIKEIIEEKENICKEQQRLLFRDTPMLDEYCIEKYGIKSGDTIYLLLQMKTGQSFLV